MSTLRASLRVEEILWHPARGYAGRVQLRFVEAPRALRTAFAASPIACVAITATALLSAPSAAWAQVTLPDEAPAPAEEAPAVTPLMKASPDEPPPSNVSFVQYGVAFTAEVPTAPGPICDTKNAPCILGTGGGIAVRVGYRTSGNVYLGAAYEVSKQDPNNLYRLALLQQARAEGRYYVGTAREAYPYGAVGLGLAGYGNEWSVDTWGPAGFFAVGVEAQISQRTVVGAALAYRLAYLSHFVDTSGAPRDAGVVQMLGLDLVLEQREPTSRPAGGTADPGR